MKTDVFSKSQLMSNVFICLSLSGEIYVQQLQTMFVFNIHQTWGFCKGFVAVMRYGLGKGFVAVMHYGWGVGKVIDV